MATEAEKAKLVAEGEEISRSGVKSVTTDGTNTQVDLAHVDKVTRRMQRSQKCSQAKRPYASGVNLGGFQG